MRRGQTGIEFLQTMMILGLLFIIFTLFIANEFSFLFGEDEQTAAARRVAYDVADEVNAAYNAGDGYHSTFTLPQWVAGREYAVYYNSTTRLIEVDVTDLGDTDRYAVARHLPAGAVLQNVTSGTLTVRNTAGTIVVKGGFP